MNETSPVYCSFCGMDQFAPTVMIASGMRAQVKAYICDICIEHAAAVVRVFKRSCGETEYLSWEAREKN